jgi:CelD/BcsL family acetyltransferase involved in cellulose biosynthesis
VELADDRQQSYLAPLSTNMTHRFSATSGQRVPSHNPEPISLVSADVADANAWDTFVEAHPFGRFCQLWGYRQALEEAYKLNCQYLKILRGQQQVGVFPSVVAGRFPRRLLSQPFNEYGGPLLKELSLSQAIEVGDALIDAAREHHCAVVQIRGGLGCKELESSPRCAVDPVQSYGILRLADSDTVWNRLISRGARRSVRWAQDYGLRTEVRLAAQAVAGPFYHLYLMSMKRLGVPPHAHRFFEALAAGIGDRLVGAWVTHGSEVVSVLLGAVSGTRLHIYITASDKLYWHMRPNDLAQWSLLEWASAHKVEIMDFGSAAGDGQLRFKKKWGAELCQYNHLTLQQPGTPIPQHQHERSIPKLIWRTVVPARGAAVIGPLLRRRLL